MALSWQRVACLFLCLVQPALRAIPIRVWTFTAPSFNWLAVCEQPKGIIQCENISISIDGSPRHTHSQLTLHPGTESGSAPCLEASTLPSPSYHCHCHCLMHRSTASPSQRAMSQNHSVDVAVRWGARGIRRAMLGDTDRPIAEQEAGEVNPQREALKELATKVQMDDGTVIIVIVNDAYLDFFLNWARFMQRLNLHRHVLVFALNEAVQGFSDRMWPGQSILYRLSVAEGLPAVHLNDSAIPNYGSADFFYKMMQRSLYIRILLSLGFSTLNSDLDMVLLQDPTPFTSNRSFDMVVAFNGMWNELTDCMRGWDDTRAYFNTGLARPGYINNGFMFMRPTEATMKVVDMWIGSMTKTGPVPGTSDLDHFNWKMKELLSNNSTRDWLTLGIFPPAKFPAGNVSFSNKHDYLLNRSEVVTIYASYVVGRHLKMLRLMNAGAWLVTMSEEQGFNMTDAVELLNSTLLLNTSKSSPRPMLPRQQSEGAEEQRPPTAGEGDGAVTMMMDTSSKVDLPEEVLQDVREETWDDTGGDLEDIKESSWQLPAEIEEMARQAARDSMLVVTTVSEGEEMLFFNWARSLNSTGLDDCFLAFTHHQSVATRILSVYPDRCVLMPPPPLPPPSSSHHTSGVAPHTSLFLPLLLHRIVTTGISCFFSPVNSVWLQSPLPYITPFADLFLRLNHPLATSTAPAPPQHTADITPDSPPSPDGVNAASSAARSALIGNASPFFLFVRPSDGTAAFLELWARRVVASHGSLTHSLQSHLNRALASFLPEEMKVEVADAAGGGGGADVSGAAGGGAVVPGARDGTGMIPPRMVAHAVSKAGGADMGGQQHRGSEGDADDELRPIEAEEAGGSGGAGQGSEGVGATGRKLGEESFLGQEGSSKALLSSQSNRMSNDEGGEGSSGGGNHPGDSGSAVVAPKVSPETLAGESVGQLPGSSSRQRRRRMVSSEGGVLRVGVLPVMAFPPGRLSLLLPGWLAEHKSRVVVVSDDVHRTVEEREAALKAAGLWVVESGEGGERLEEEEQERWERMSRMRSRTSNSLLFFKETLKA